MASQDQRLKTDTDVLHSLGYAQELRRAMGGFSNFAISFTIISILTGAITLFSYGFGNGGPLEEGLGWPIIAFFTVFVALSMAELASAFPTAGALYYFAGRLGGPAWSYYTGWFNLIGQITITAGIDYGCALFAVPLLGLPADPGHTLVVYAVILALHGMINHVGTRVVSTFNSISAWWHMVGVIVIVAALLAAAHHPVSYAFSSGITTVKGLPYGYLFMIGLLQAQWTFTGYDASAHVSEETNAAARYAPRGIILSVVVSAIFGYILLMGLTLASGSYTHIMGQANPVIAIMQGSLGATLGTFLLWVIVIAMWFCGLASVTSNSRMIYAFSRDGALPFSQFIHKVHHHYRIPVRAVWLAVVGAFVPMLVGAFSPYVYSIVTSISVIGLYVAYVIPVYLGRRTWGTKWTEKGPFDLGRFSGLVAWVAICWVIFISIILVLPEAPLPVTLANMNWALPTLAFVILCVTVAWFTSVRHWFKGPRAQGTAEELQQIEAELEEDATPQTSP